MKVGAVFMVVMTCAGWCVQSSAAHAHSHTGMQSNQLAETETETAGAGYDKSSCDAKVKVERNDETAFLQVVGRGAHESAAGEVKCDWQCYLDRYAGLTKVCSRGKNMIGCAKKHWVTHGFKEGRDCTCPTTDSEKDKGKGSSGGHGGGRGRGSSGGGSTGGRGRGRGRGSSGGSSTGGCDYQCYLDRYPKLNAFFKGDLTKAEKHYDEYGKGEKRDCRCRKPGFDEDCDWQCYLDRYPALNKNLGGDLIKAKEHYDQWGFKEGRKCTCMNNPCDWRCYLDRYPKLEEVLGKDNYLGAQNHYEFFGKQEMRDCTCPKEAPEEKCVPTDWFWPKEYSDDKIDCSTVDFSAMGIGGTEFVKKNGQRYCCPVTESTTPAPTPAPKGEDCVPADWFFPKEFSDDQVDCSSYDWSAPGLEAAGDLLVRKNGNRYCCPAEFETPEDCVPSDWFFPKEFADDRIDCSSVDWSTPGLEAGGNELVKKDEHRYCCKTSVAPATPAPTQTTEECAPTDWFFPKEFSDDKIDCSSVTWSNVGVGGKEFVKKDGLRYCCPTTAETQTKEECVPTDWFWPKEFSDDRIVCSSMNWSTPGLEAGGNELVKKNDQRYCCPTTGDVSLPPIEDSCVPADWFWPKEFSDDRIDCSSMDWSTPGLEAGGEQMVKQDGKRYCCPTDFTAVR